MAALQVGYIRLSRMEGDEAAQRDLLQQAGVASEDIFVDDMREGLRERPALEAAMLRAVEAGGTICVTSISRLGRSILGAVDTLYLLAQRNIPLRSLSEPIDTTTSGGQDTLEVLVNMARMERKMIGERKRLGASQQHKTSARDGRSTVMTPARQKLGHEMLQAGKRGAPVWKALQAIDGPPLARSTYYAWQKDWDATHPPTELIEDH